MKNNRIFKEIAGIAAAVMVGTGMAVPVSASVTTYSITIENTTAGHTYVAYQIFAGDLSADGKLSNIQWGSGVSDTAKTAYGSAEDKAAALTDETVAAQFAKELKDTAGYLSSTTAAQDSDASDGYVLNVPAGYYLIVDTTAVAGQDDTVTKYILEVSDNIDVSPKTDKPSLEKKIWGSDTSDPTIGTAEPSGEWADTADHQIGDTVYFYTKTSVPDMTYYDTYNYVIRDDMSDGLTFSKIEKVVYIDKNGTATELTSDKYSLTSGDETSSTDFTEDFYVSFADLKTTLGDSAKGGYIYTYYSAVLNENALVSNSANSTQHNTNTAYLTYSNNPNDSTITGSTPKDIVYDWTFAFNGIKVDENDAPVAGAGFTLYDKDDTEIKLTEITDVNELKVNGITTLDSATRYYKVDSSGTDSILTTDTKNKFMIVGLDDKTTYTLEETTTPDGYNTCKPIEFNLTSAYNTDGSELTSLTNGASDPNSIEIENKSGSTLPSTGGIGTKIFYIGGGSVAAIAGVFLIAKKRMGR